jgi:hypothetical protein
MIQGCRAKATFERSDQLHHWAEWKKVVLKSPTFTLVHQTVNVQART